MTAVVELALDGPWSWSESEGWRSDLSTTARVCGLVKGSSLISCNKGVDSVAVALFIADGLCAPVNLDILNPPLALTFWKHSVWQGSLYPKQGPSQLQDGSLPDVSFENVLLSCFGSAGRSDVACRESTAPVSTWPAEDISFAVSWLCPVLLLFFGMLGR